MRAAKPTPSADDRLKAFFFGPPDRGKTVGSILAFPKAVIIDTENGCNRYKGLIVEQGSVLLQTNDAEVLLDEIRSLMSEEHDYNTLIIDPYTNICQSIQERWSQLFRDRALKKGEKEQAEFEDFGFRYWGKVKATHKRLMSLLGKLDMNVVMTCHQKKAYEAVGDSLKQIGLTFDGEKSLDYFFDFVFRVDKAGTRRMAECLKQRSFPSQIFKPSFEWTPEILRKTWGVEKIERKAATAPLASEEQVAELNMLLSALLREGKDTTKLLAQWLRKADVDELIDMRADHLQACINWSKDQLKPLAETK
jgi:hypothetical protein